MAITEQRKLFVDEFIKLRCKNATKAAIDAGYSPKTAQSQASQLLKDSNVLKYLEERKNQLKRELQEEFVFDALEARKIMHKILNDGEARDADRIKVATDFLDRAGFKASDKVELSGNVGNHNPFAELTTEEIKEYLGKKKEKLIGDG